MLECLRNAALADEEDKSFSSEFSGCNPRKKSALFLQQRAISPWIKSARVCVPASPDCFRLGAVLLFAGPAFLVNPPCWSAQPRGRGADETPTGIMKTIAPLETSCDEQQQQHLLHHPPDDSSDSFGYSARIGRTGTTLGLDSWKMSTDGERHEDDGELTDGH